MTTRTRPDASEKQRQITEGLDAIRRIIRVLRRSSRSVEQEFGIGSAQLFVLQQLAQAPVSSVNELAARTYTHQSSVSTVVGRLVEEGLVERQPAADDLRRRQLRLTRRGQRLVDRAPVPAQIRLIEGLRSLSPAELETLSALLNQVVRGMGATDEPPALLFSESPTLRRRKKH